MQLARQLFPFFFTGAQHLSVKLGAFQVALVELGDQTAVLQGDACLTGDYLQDFEIASCEVALAPLTCPQYLYHLQS